MVSQAIADEPLTELYDFFENAPIGVEILAAEGAIVYANRADLRLNGREEARGHVSELHDAGGELLGRVARGEHVLALRTQLRGTSQRVVIHASGHVEGGTLVEAYCFTFADPPPVAAAQSVPPLTAPDEELLERLERAFRYAPIGLHIVGPDGIVRRANPVELETLGYAERPGDYLGHHIAEFHAEQAVIDDMLERLVGGRPLTHYRATLRTRDGDTTPVVIYSSPRFDDGEFVNTRCFTFSAAVATGPELPSFGWPRNEDGPEGGELTTVLQRLAGRKHAEASLGFLAAASMALAATGDHVAGLEAVCRLTVPFLADACLVELAGTTAATTGRQAPGAVLRTDFATRDGDRGAVVLTREEGRDAFGRADAALAEEVSRRVAAAIETGRLRARLAAGPNGKEKP
jgi:PAS domain S-box-containing protein